MNYTIEHIANDAAIIHVGKNLDYRNVDDFKHSCHASVEQGVYNFILDFSETGILDSSGLGAIFSLHREVTTKQGKVYLAALSHPVKVIAQITRILRVFPDFPSIDAAVAALTTHARHSKTFPNGIGSKM